jgi:hypothetical protein
MKFPNRIILAWFLLYSFGISISRAGSNYGTTNDLWDISRGTIVVRSSPSATQNAYAPEDIFGGNLRPHSPEPGDFIFADGFPASHIGFVEWRTLAPVTIDHYELYSAGDGPKYGNQREFSRFRLLAKSPGSQDFDLVLSDVTPSHPFINLFGIPGLALSETIPAVTAQDFRAEFTSYTTNYYNGVRVMELDGFGPSQPWPEAGVTTVAKFWWKSVADRIYQPQSWDLKSNGPWTNLGDTVVGNGEIQSLYDETKTVPGRLYRVVDVTPVGP